MTHEIDPNIEDINDAVHVPEKVRGQDLFFAPQPMITAVDNQTVDATYTTQERDVLINCRQRINDLETVLNNLGLLRKS